MRSLTLPVAALLFLAACTSQPAASQFVRPLVVDVPSIAGGSVMALTIDDRSGRLVEARGAAIAEVEQAGGLAGDTHIAATGVPGHADSVLVRWIAFGCDTSGRLTIAPDVAGITVAPGPIGQCDALGDMRGVVLGFRPPAASASLHLDLLPAPSTEAAVSARPTRPGPSPTDAVSPTPTAEPLADVLARHNKLLTSAESGSAPVIGEDRALAAAREFYTLGTPVVWLGRLTVTDWRLGADENAPLAVEDRLVYVVQLTGLTLYPFGGDGDVHHEMVVFIDALTGDFVTATTVR